MSPVASTTVTSVMTSEARCASAVTSAATDSVAVEEKVVDFHECRFRKVGAG